MTTEDLEKLEYCCKATGKSRSEIVREGIHEVYARLHNLEEN
ncbi:ribbon-helix-helix protein, CopG family [Lachnospiraceae bacterium 64-25]